MAKDFSFAERGRAECSLDNVCRKREIVGGDCGGESSIGCLWVDRGVHLVGGSGREGDGVRGCGGYRLVGVEREDIGEARWLVQEGLQVSIGFENSRCDEDVVVADYLLGLLAYESEESGLGHGRRRLSVVDGSQEGGCCSGGVFGMLRGSIDSLRVHERLG